MDGQTQRHTGTFVCGKLEKEEVNPAIIVRNKRKSLETGDLRKEWEQETKF